MSDTLFLFGKGKKEDISLRIRPGIKQVFTDDCLSVFDLAEQKDSKLTIWKEKEAICFLYGTIFSEGMTGKRIIRTYRKNGISALSNISGRFLIIIYNKQTHTLICFRDSIGLQHGYYSKIGSSYIISTSLPLLLKTTRILGMSMDVDPRGIGYYICFQYLPSPFTLFKNKYQIPPKTFLEFTFSSERRIVYDPIFEGSNGFTTKTLEENVEDIKELLVSSINKQLAFATKRVGVLLSGGMDTSTAVSLLVEECGIKPIAFTAAFSEKGYDESEDARVVAQKFGLHHEVVMITPEMIEFIPTIVKAYDSPLGDKSVLAEFFIFRILKDFRISHLVTGEGGDEIFGYPRSRDGNEMYSNLSVVNNQLAKFYLEITSVSPHKERKMLLNNLGIESMLGENYLEGLYSKWVQLSAFEKLYVGQWNTWLIEDVNMKDSQLAKYLNVNVILPFVDINIMKYMVNLSLSKKLEGLSGKRFLKMMMKETLPYSILKKPKHKFWLPFDEWLRREKYDYLRENLLQERSLVDNYFDKKIIKRIIHTHKNRRQDNSRLLWALLFLNVWYKAIKDAYETN